MDSETAIPEGGPEAGAGDTARRRFRAILVIALVLLAVVAITTSARWLVGERRSAAPDDGPRFFGCLMELPVRDEGYCERAAADYGRRAQVTDAQRHAAEGMADEIRRAAASAGWCMPQPDPSCLPRPSSREPRAEDVEAARLWLGRTGFSYSSARLARSDDPAPVGSLLYAARVGDACVVGHVNSVPEGGGSYRVVGLLPDGRCLSD